MDLNQALGLIDGALSSLTVNRETHARLQMAVQAIAEGIQKLEQLEKGSEETKQPELVTKED